MSGSIAAGFEIHFTAIPTGVGSLASVDLHVRHQVPLPGEHLAALTTPQLRGVNHLQHDRSQVRGRSALFQGWHSSIILSVDLSLVFQSITGVFEGLITYSAGVRSLTAVRQQMLLKVFLCSTDFPTELTGFFRLRKRFHPILQLHIGSR